MTRVCLVGAADVNLRYQLLSYETARNALLTYDLSEPFENTIALDTVSLGAAVSLLNDLNWYLVRYVDQAMILEPSISETEWLSRALATAIRTDEITAAESGRFLKVYGVQTGSEEAESDQDAVDAPADKPRLVEPMFVTRTGETIPDYDLQAVDETLRVRVTESEFGA